jgi:hypothetical protein
MSLSHCCGLRGLRTYGTSTRPRKCKRRFGSGKLNFHSNLPPSHVIAITVVTGVHAGCYELLAHGGIRGIADLKGKTVGGDSRWLSLIVAYIGLDPKTT